MTSRGCKMIEEKRPAVAPVSAEERPVLPNLKIFVPWSLFVEGGVSYIICGLNKLKIYTNHK